jgi:SAM-dependent methyltransferase
VKGEVHAGHASCDPVTGASRFLIGLATPATALQEGLGTQNPRESGPAPMDERTRTAARLTRERWEANLARSLTSSGAAVLGVDSCQGLIEAAGRLGAASFARASVDTLPIRDEAIDLVVGNHLFSHLPDPAGAIREFGRVLKRGGRLVILTLHPCFYTEHSENGVTQSVPVSRYFAARGVDQHFVVDGLTSPSMITSWLRPLEYYSTTLREAGFVITELREPRPTDEQLENDPWWHQGFPTALFLLLVAERR